MHIREDGHWKKKRLKKTKKKKLEESVDSLTAKTSETSEATTPLIDEKGEKKVADTASEDGDGEGDDHGGMTMFNVVFVLNLSKQDAREKTYEIYEHVIKKFNKVLKHAQAEDNFVWKESERILAIKEKAREESE